MKAVLTALIIWVLAAMVAKGAGPTSCMASITITSLPYTIPYSDTCYTLSSNLSSTTDGIYIDGDTNITIDGNDDTIFFNTANGNGKYGLYIDGAPPNTGHNITIKHLTIYHNPSDTTVDSNYCILLGSAGDLYVQNCNVRISGYTAHGVYKETSAIDSSYNVWIDSGTYRSAVTSYYSRCNSDGQVIQIQNNKLASSGYDYHWRITNIVVDTAPAGIAAKGLIQFQDNTITIDGRNDQYSYPSGNTCFGAANGAGIGISKIEAGSYIRGNRIKAGTGHLGMDEGILLQTVQGTAASPVYVDSNIITSHFGKDPADGYSGVDSKAIKWRWGNKYLIIEHNTCSTFVDSMSGSSYGINTNTLRMENTNWDNADWVEGQKPDSFCTIRYNHAVATALDTFFNHAEAAMLTGGAEPGDPLEGIYNWDSAGNVWQYNTLQSNHWVYQMSGAGIGNNMTVAHDTVTWASPHLVPQSDNNPYTYAVTQGAVNDTNLTARDQYYTIANTDTSIDIWNTPTAADLTLERTYSLLVLGSDAQPVAGASVWIIDAYSDTQSTGTTDVSGQVTATLKYWKELVGLDSAAFNPFSIKTLKVQDSSSHSFSLAWDAYTDTLTLLNTLGGGIIYMRARGIK